ncbi:MAG TPA: hypothetical protein VFN55_16810 [Solirubrobacteraceae bacterium]|nr:hypothetical protein [Solirubrobacteraceae bacterium]
MSRRDPNYDPELAKQIMANVKAGRARPTAPPPLTPGGIVRRFFNVGFIGSEPFEARRPVARTYAAEWGTLIAIFVVASGNVVAGLILALAMAAIGAPKAWTWTQDRIGSGLWSISAILLVAAAAAWAGGGAARAIVTHHHGHIGTAQALALIGVFIGLLACYRRWGTGGARGHVAVHDAQDAAILSEAVRRDGRGHGPNATEPASDTDTAGALDDAYRRDH